MAYTGILIGDGWTEYRLADGRSGSPFALEVRRFQVPSGLTPVRTSRSYYHSPEKGYSSWERPPVTCKAAKVPDSVEPVPIVLPDGLTRAEVERRLAYLYERKHPAKIGDVVKLMAKYKGKETAMYKAFLKK